MRFTTHLKTQFKHTVNGLGLVLIGLACFAWTNAMAGSPDPYVKADQSWITISGQVESVAPDTFVLDYDKGKIVVEMDDGDRDADAYKLMPGDKVIVSGRIDDDFFETTTIEAYSVYIKNIDTTFFASAMDEEGSDKYAVNILAPLSDYQFNLVGKVSEVKDDEFMLDTGTRSVRVEVDEMAYNPLDDEGYQRIEKGDRVSVSGRFEYDIFEGREVEAETVMKLNYADS